MLFAICAVYIIYLEFIAEHLLFTNSSRGTFYKEPSVLGELCISKTLQRQTDSAVVSSRNQTDTYNNTEIEVHFNPRNGIFLNDHILLLLVLGLIFLAEMILALALLHSHWNIFAIRIEKRNWENLQDCYNMLLDDLEEYHVKFIQTIYIYEEKGKICIDVNQRKRTLVLNAISKLPKYSSYKGILEFESNSGELLAGNDRSGPQYNRLLGSGSLITSFNNAEANILLKEKALRTVQDMRNKFKGKETGTLSCIVKHGSLFYTMTAQHVLDKRLFVSEAKQVLSQVHFECDQLHLSDIVQVATSFSGRMCIIPESQMAVDVALMPLNQTRLDESSLIPICVYKSDKIGEIAKKRVTKYGATTGLREGKLVLPRCRASIDPQVEDSPNGEMFAVVGIASTNQTFAEKGDSGAIVTISLDNKKYAIGIVVQVRRPFMGHNAAALCVKLDHCLKALEDARGLPEKIDSSKLELFEGFLKPDAILYDRSSGHLLK